jgi:hypothetical protein
MLAARGESSVAVGSKAAVRLATKAGAWPIKPEAWPAKPGDKYSHRERAEASCQQLLDMRLPVGDARSRRAVFPLGGDMATVHLTDARGVSGINGRFTACCSANSSVAPNGSARR